MLIQFVECELVVYDKTLTKFKGETLNEIFHILYNLLHNAVTHCGVENPECILIFEKKNEYLNITVKNKIFTNIVKVENEIRLITQKLKDKNLIKVNNEGGTGFYKIKNILDNILKIKNEIKIYISEEEEFVVEIVLEERIISNESIDYRG